MKIINFTIDDELANDFRESLVSTYCTQPQVLRAAVVSYVKGELTFVRGELVCMKEHGGSRATQPVEQVIENKKKGPKLKERHEEHVDLESDPKKSYIKGVGIDPSLRTLESYNHPVAPDLSVDDRTHLRMDSPDGHGKMFEDYVKEHWIEFRKRNHTPGYTEASDWFDITKDIFLVCISNKFIEDNNLKLRYHPSEMETAFIELNQDLEVLYAEELKELYAEKEDS